MSNDEEILTLRDLDIELISVVDKLIKIIDQKNSISLFRFISKDFMIERDFGGIYNPAENAVVNFLSVFHLDPGVLAEEYKVSAVEDSWKVLSGIVNGVVTRRKKTTQEVCFPNGEISGDIVLDSMLCFEKQSNNNWKISSFVYAGD